MGLATADATMTEHGKKVSLAVRSRRVIVTWTDGPTPDPFLATMTIRLRRDGAAGSEILQAADSQPPRRLTFDVPDGVSLLQLEVKIPSPDPVNAPGPILDLTQDITCPTNAADPLKAATSTNATGPGAPRTTPLHPRVLMTQRQGATFIDLDVRFLNVTDYAASLINRRFNEFTLRTHQCKWFVLVHTRGSPVMWAVGVPPAVAQSDPNVNALLFFQNELVRHRTADTPDAALPGGYSSTEDLDYGRLGAYVDQPGATTSRFSVGSYIDPRMGGHFVNYPQFGWDKQLADSGKNVVFVFPFPMAAAGGTDFGAIAGPGQAKVILASLFRALQADGMVANRTDGLPRRKRLAIGGWSSGVISALTWMEADGDGIVDEAYLFDGESIASGPWLDSDAGNGFPKIRSWFGKKSRKLRMIGTAYTEQRYNQIAATLKSPDVTSRPNDTEYWYKDPFYNQALANGPTIPSLDPLGSAESTPATEASHVFFVSQTMKTAGGATNATLELGKTGLKSKVLSQISHVEAASLLQFSSITGGLTSIAQADFDNFMAALQTSTDPNETQRISKLRHPWSVFGGTGPPFKGFFQICLEESGFIT